MPLDTRERGLLDQACAAVPFPAQPPAIGSDADYTNFVENLMLTVLDLQLHNVIVNNSITHFRTHLGLEICTLDDLETLLASYSPDREGNREAAMFVWGYKYGDRLGRLRSLVAWARAVGITDEEALVAWANRSDFYRDWNQQIKGLGPAAFCWLLMRMGVDIVKPDSWLHGFLRRTVGRDLGNMDLVDEICASARRIGRGARDLDAGIWETERGGPGSI